MEQATGENRLRRLVALLQSPSTWRSLVLSPVLPFAALSLLLLWWHEPWRDEAQAWLIVRDTTSFAQLRHVLAYEGTPALWHALLWPLAKLGLPFLAARVLAAAAATACVAILWKHAPFPNWARWLLCFGYFLAYEYDAIARSYVLGFLFLLLLAACDRLRFERPGLYALLLAGLANTSFHGLLLAAVLGGAHLVEVVRRKEFGRNTWVAAAVAAAGLVLAAYQMRPPADVAGYLTEWHFGLDGEKFRFANEIVVASFLPVPQAGVPFWRIGYFPDLLGAFGTEAVGIFLFTSAVIALRRRPAVLATWIFGSLLLLAFFLFKDYRGARHAGLLFGFTLYCFWVAWARTEPTPTARRTNRAGKREVARSPWGARVGGVAVAVLLVQCVGAGVAIRNDATGVFSEGQEAAAYLADHGYLDNRTLIIGFHSYVMASVLANLAPSVRFYLPEEGGFGSYTVWNQTGATADSMTLDEILATSPAFGPGQSYDRAVLVLSLSDKLTGTKAAQARLMPITTLVPQNIGQWSERFSIFEVKPQP